MGRVQKIGWPAGILLALVATAGCNSGYSSGTPEAGAAEPGLMNTEEVRTVSTAQSRHGNVIARYHHRTKPLSKEIVTGVSQAPAQN
jgi:hypothetical protein